MEKPSVWRLVAWWPPRASVREFFVHYCCPVVVEPVTGIVTLVAPHCFLPQQQPPAPPPPILVHRSPNKATSPSLFMSIKDGSCWSPHLRLTSRATSCGFSPPCGRGTGFARCLLLQHWAGCGCTVRARALCTVHCARQTPSATKNGEKLPSRKEKASEGKLDAARNCVGTATRRHNSARKGLLKNLTLWLDRSQSLFYFVPQEKNITVKLATVMDLSWVPEMTSRVITCSSIFIFNSLCNQICYLWDQTPMAMHLKKLRSGDKDPICDGLNCHLSSASDD